MNCLMEIEKIEYAVGNGIDPIQISTCLTAGAALRIAGPSGVGKTTLLRIIARLADPLQGVIRLNGTSWADIAPPLWRRRVHYLSQKPVLYDGSVRENLKKPFELVWVKKELSFEPNRAIEIMEKLNLPITMMDQDARTLSGGEASRMALVRAILTEPSVLLLDEPLAALDADTAEATLTFLRSWCLAKEGRGIIIVSHAGNLDALPGLQVINIPTQGGKANE